jgi:hypothetical protein
MSKYQYETDQFGISEEGIHLLRSRFNYETISYSTIEAIQFEKGKQIKNWVLMLIIGLALLGIGLFMAYKVICEFFFANNFHRFYMEQFALPVLPIFIGAYSLYYSLKNGTILKVQRDKKQIKIRIGNVADTVTKDIVVILLKHLPSNKIEIRQ